MSHFISFVRIPALAIRQHIRPLPPLHVLEEDRLRMRVLPNDIDINLHLNNARYLGMMDYARTHMLARSRLLERIIRRAGRPWWARCGSPIGGRCRCFRSSRSQRE